jgi:hypothetical protein
VLTAKCPTLIQSYWNHVDVKCTEVACACFHPTYNNNRIFQRIIWNVLIVF